MVGTLASWPAWKEFPVDDGTTSTDPDYAEAKKTIINEFGETALRESWIQVCEDLSSVTDEIASKESSVVPVFDGTQVLEDGFTEDEVSSIKRYGCFIVRNVIPRPEIVQLYQDVRQYIEDNRSNIGTWPEDNPSMFVIYDSPTQIALRTHPNHLKLQRKLNGLWHDDSGETSSSPLLFSDGVRDRPPGPSFLGLGPHVDAGSLARWADPGYRKTYAKIFAGTPREYDAFDLTARKDANQYLFPGRAHSTVLRAFQGWTALTRAAPSEGTIMLYPNVKTAIAYMLLRPFFKPPEKKEDLMDAEKWTFGGEGAWFPGTPKPLSQQLSRSSHPHLRLEECLVHVPEMQAGDTVWWHSDMCHAVDPLHKGTENAAVAYIAAVPTTRQNMDYIAKQLRCTLEGRAPPDYDDGMTNEGGLDERKFKGYVGHEGLSGEARRALGYREEVSE